MTREDQNGMPWIDRALAITAGSVATALRTGAAGRIPKDAQRAIRAFDRAAQKDPAERWPPPPPPLVRLIRSFDLTSEDVQLLLLAAMPDADDTLATAFSALHPSHRPWPTVGLGLSILAASGSTEAIGRARLTQGPLVQRDLIHCRGEDPLGLRELCLPAGVWTMLLGGDGLLAPLQSAHATPGSAGLSTWLGQEACVTAADLLRAHQPISVVVSGQTVEAALHRALALCETAEIPHRAVALGPPPFAADPAQALALHAVLSGTVPVLSLPQTTEAQTPLAPPLTQFMDHPGPLVLATASGSAADLGDRPTVYISAPPLTVAEHQEMWRALAPELADAAPDLAARLPLEPYRARQALQDLTFAAGPPDAARLTECFRRRAAQRVPSSTTLIEPKAGWPQLVLPQREIGQLEDAVQRLHGQAQVLGQWRFLADRRGARGVRLLFAGPPGTGKTLAAEVLAGNLGADLLTVDLSRTVSKWVGETEKNLAEVFDAAEEMRAVLFFDEAEVLFAKRTDVNDAHDRYANLESAYLLARLERYDGLAVLATNFRRNIDGAFTRRLDYILDFPEPGTAEREELWRVHLPDEAPLALDVDVAELARLYPLTGGQIRNASLSAAYFAAQAGTALTRTHFYRGIRREYEKAGQAFRELAPHEIS